KRSRLAPAEQAATDLVCNALRNESQLSQCLRKDLQNEQQHHERCWHELERCRHELERCRHELARYEAVKDVGPLTLRLAGRAHALSTRFPRARRVGNGFLRLSRRLLRGLARAA